MRTRSKKKLTKGTRAIWDDEKASRELELLEGALVLFIESEYQDISVIDICKRASLAKGTFYLYFNSKEEIFLKLTKQQFLIWEKSLNEKLTGLSKNVPFKNASEAFVESLKGFNPLLRLFSILHSIIERNVRVDEIVPFKVEMYRIQQNQIELWQKIYPQMNQEQAVHLIIFISSSIIGVWTFSNPPKSARAAIESAGLEGSIVDFNKTLAKQIEIFLTGLLAK